MRDRKAESRAINAILWRDWDPIGCGVPEDEYESYVWPVYKLLIDGAPRADVCGVFALGRRGKHHNLSATRAS